MNRYTFLLSGIFGYYEIELAQVVEHLARAEGKPITVQLASVGGDVEVGMSIRNALAQYAERNKVDIEFDVLGWAQSTAAYLTTLPGAKVSVRDNTLFMIHNPQAGVFGDHAVLQAKLDWLVPITEQWVDAHTFRSIENRETVVAQLDAETYLMGQEIIDAGFADTLVEENTVVAIGDRSGLMARAKQEQDRLRAAAMGGPINKVPAQSQGRESVMSNIITPVTPAAAAAPVAQAAPVDNTAELLMARAKAYGQAVKELPVEQHDAVHAAFEAGKDASYFEGMVAHASALASTAAAVKEKEAHAAAQAAGGTIPSASGGAPAPAATAKAAGETGAMLEVG